MARVVERERVRDRLRERERARPVPPALPIAPPAPPAPAWELAFYVGIVAVALLLRLHDLGARALHHDESLHAVYSWKLFQGQGYVHDPMMHGPFQFHAKALMFFLFGDNDVTARLTEVLCGTGLVALVYLLRAELGRWGAMAAAVLLAFSPSLLYFSRFSREDILFAFHTLLMISGLFGYVRTRQARWLYLGSVGLALGFSTKESIYLTGFLIVTFVVLYSASEYWRARQSALWALIRSVPLSVVANCVLITVGICVVLYTTVFTNPNGIYTGTIGALRYWAEQQGVARGAQPTYYYVLLVLLYEFLALALAVGAALTVGPRRRVLALITGLTLVVAVGYFLLTRPGAPLYVGDLEEKKGWFAIGLAYAAALVFFLSSRGSFFFWFNLYWAIGTFAIYTLASEKMPWLLVHIALPLNLLGAQFVGWALARADWRRVWSAAFLLAVLLSGLAGALALAWVTAAGEASAPVQVQSALLWRLALLLLLLAAVLGLVEIGRRCGRAFLAAPVGTAAVLGLFALSIHIGWQWTYKNGDTPNDMGVYVQTSPDVPFVVHQIEYLSQVTGQGKDMLLLLDNGYTETVGGQQVVHESIAWPFEWYLRDWRNKRYFSRLLPSDPASENAPVILVMSTNLDPIRDRLANYVGQKYRLNWWYPEDYKGWTPQQLWDGLRDPQTRLKLWRYFLFREPLNPLGSRDFYFYVRSDLARGVVAGTTGAPSPAAAPLGPTATGASGEPATGLDTAPAAVVRPDGLVLWGRTTTGTPLLLEPKGLARDAAGRLYVTDTRAHRVSVFNPDGTLALQFGRLGDGDGEFNEPWGIGVAPNGEIYVADTWNHRIQKFDASGRFLTKWGYLVDARGQRDAEPGGFWGPRAVVIGPDGNVYVADTGNKRIQVFDPNGRFLRAIGGEGSALGQFREPVGLAIDSAGNLYVADTWNQRVQKLDNSGRGLAQYSIPAWSSQAITNKPYLAIDAQGTIWATVPEERRVVRIDPDGRIQPAPEFASYSFQLPIGVVASADGGVWASDSTAGVVVQHAVRSAAATPADAGGEPGGAP
ncbi:MAG TPA: flippase activity-associated protein Agl23 [Chloroflexota bacterium]|nr:flippase activity-associated protein Agl23 [Chloroflexota bacterium]